MKFRRVEAELLHAERQTNIMKKIVAFSNLGKKLKMPNKI